MRAFSHHPKTYLESPLQGARYLPPVDIAVDSFEVAVIKDVFTAGKVEFFPAIALNPRKAPPLLADTSDLALHSVSSMRCCKKVVACLQLSLIHI